MNVQFNTDAVLRRGAPVPAAVRAQDRCLFLLTPSKEECGVKSFARLLVSALQNDYSDDGYAVLAVSSRWRDLPAALRKIAAADQIVFSVPLVAWKRLLLLPLVILVFACMVRCRSTSSCTNGRRCTGCAGWRWRRSCCSAAPSSWYRRSSPARSPARAGFRARHENAGWCRMLRPSAAPARRASPSGCCACAKPPKAATW